MEADSCDAAGFIPFVFFLFCCGLLAAGVLSFEFIVRGFGLGVIMPNDLQEEVAPMIRATP